MCRIDNAGAYISNELKLFKIVHTELRFILSKVVYFFGSCRSSSHDISVFPVVMPTVTGHRLKVY